MAENVYECMCILDPNKYARDAVRVSGTVSEMVEKVGGVILANRLWTEQRLAYPIKGRRKGAYWLTYFRLDGSKLREFNRLCQLNDNILRHLVLRVDPRLVDALVSHALGQTKEAAGREAESTQSAKGRAPPDREDQQPAPAATEAADR